MFDRLFPVLVFTAAIGSGIVAGIFFAFSSFVMAALGRLSPEHGIAAMQSINITVINPGFMLVFMGTGLVCLALLVGAFWWDGTGGKLIMTAGALYLVGCIGVTMVCNVPLNDALAAVEAGTPQAAELWARYLRDWTFWNHVRTVAPLASMILFIIALR
jgi:uncharacterized membrane protein